MDNIYRQFLCTDLSIISPVVFDNCGEADNINRY